MGGKIWVESDPGAGCKFSFLIPFKPALPPPARGKLDEANRKKSCWSTMNPGMLRYIKTLLEVDDYKVETATTGEEAASASKKACVPIWCCSTCSCPASTAWRLSSNCASFSPA
jgi:hypothetical protein